MAEIDRILACHRLWMCGTPCPTSGRAAGGAAGRQRQVRWGGAGWILALCLCFKRRQMLKTTSLEDALYLYQASVPEVPHEPTRWVCHLGKERRVPQVDSGGGRRRQQGPAAARSPPPHSPHARQPWGAVAPSGGRGSARCASGARVAGRRDAHRAPFRSAARHGGTPPCWRLLRADEDAPGLVLPVVRLGSVRCGAVWCGAARHARL